MDFGDVHGTLQRNQYQSEIPAVELEQKLPPGSFEHAVNQLLEHEFDLAIFDGRYRNDQSGVSAYPPGMPLKVILCANAQGVVSIRGNDRLCREHVTLIILSGDSAPHFTTLATIVSSLDSEVAQLFARVPYLCNRQGLIWRKMVAVDGVKLPSNAKSGTRTDFAHQTDGPIFRNCKLALYSVPGAKLKIALSLPSNLLFWKPERKWFSG